MTLEADAVVAQFWFVLKQVVAFRLNTVDRTPLFLRQYTRWRAGVPFDTSYTESTIVFVSGKSCVFFSCIEYLGMYRSVMDHQIGVFDFR